MPGTAAALNRITAPNAYTAAAAIEAGVFLDHLNLDVNNQAIYWSIKQVMSEKWPPQQAAWQPEVYMGPGSRTIDRPGLVGIRVRAAIPSTQLPAGALQAVVTVEAVQA